MNQSTPLFSHAKLVILDLDNCLAEAREVGDELFEAGFQAIRSANHGTLDDAAMQAAFSDCWRHPLDWVAERHGFSAEMLQAGWEAFSQMEVRHPMRGYGDLPELLKLPQHRALVTSGFRRLQESKIRALDLSQYLHELYVDAIDEPERIAKRDGSSVSSPAMASHRRSRGGGRQRGLRDRGGQQPRHSHRADYAPRGAPLRDGAGAHHHAGRVARAARLLRRHCLRASEGFHKLMPLAGLKVSTAAMGST